VEKKKGMYAISFLKGKEVLPPEVLLNRDLCGLGVGQLADNGRNVERGGTDCIELREIEARSSDASLADD
jgi:hypothetical protein